jgi:hypothetical protein
MANVLVDPRIAGERAAAAQTVTNANAAFDQLVKDYAASPDQRASRDREQLSRLQNDPFHLGRKLDGHHSAVNEQMVLEARIRQAEAAALAEAASETSRIDHALAGVLDQSGIETTVGQQIPARDLTDAVQQDLQAGVRPELLRTYLATGETRIPGAHLLADVWFEKYERDPEMQMAHQREDPTICRQFAYARLYRAGKTEGPLSDKDVAYLRSLGARI